MAGYRYSAQWDQRAQRDTVLVDPVLVVRPLSRWDFAVRRPVSEVDRALVFAGAQGGLAVYIPPQRPPRAELTSGRWVSVHEVDMGLHHFQRAFRLPSANDAFTFHAEVDFAWRVLAPDMVVQSQLRDVPAHLVPRLEQRLRRVTRRHAVEDSHGAESAVRDELAREQLAPEMGLQVTPAVRLTMDEAAREQHQALRDLGYQTERIAPQAELERRQHELEALRLSHRHQLERAEQAHQQELLTERAKYYAWYLEQRGVTGWALEIAQRPEDLAQIRKLHGQEQLALINEQLNVLDRVAGGEHFESYQLEKPVRAALEMVREYFARPPGPAAEHPGDIAALDGPTAPPVEQAAPPPRPDGEPR